MTDIFEEVKHELQQEKLHLVVRKHYKGAIALIAIILISTVLYVYSRDKRIREQEALSEEYYNSFVVENKIGIVKESDLGKLINFKSSIYGKLARLKYADSLVQAKEPVKAIQLLFDMIEVSKKDLEIANLAKIKAAEIVMKYKLESYNEKVLDILKKSIRKSNAPYFSMLKFLLGQLLIESGQKKEALELLRELNQGEETPENIRFLTATVLSNYLE